MGRRIYMFILLFLVAFINLASAQKTITFHPCYGTDLINLVDSPYQSNDKDSITISLFRCYISGMELWTDDKKVWTDNNKAHLINAANSSTLKISLSIPNNINYNQIKFNLGIDSTTNVAGVIGGDLDPMRGMYWAWQSGYINTKLEGSSPLCNTRNHQFEFHLGGYRSPFYSLQQIVFPIKASDKIAVFIDLKKMLGMIALNKTNQIMTPSKEAVDLSKKLANSFETR